MYIAGCISATDPADLWPAVGVAVWVVLSERGQCGRHLACLHGVHSSGDRSAVGSRNLPRPPCPWFRLDGVLLPGGRESLPVVEPPSGGEVVRNALVSNLLDRGDHPPNRVVLAFDRCDTQFGRCTGRECRAFDLGGHHPARRFDDRDEIRVVDQFRPIVRRVCPHRRSQQGCTTEHQQERADAEGPRRPGATAASNRVFRLEGCHRPEGSVHPSMLVPGCVVALSGRSFEIELISRPNKSALDQSSPFSYA